MSWHPNRDAVRFFLTEVWPGLVKEIPDLRLFLIGRNPPKEARTAPHAGRIEAPGFVDDVRRYLARSHVFIVPIRVGGGTRLKIVDAMAAGKAVVSSAIGYEGLRVVDGEHLVRADSPEEYQDKIERLLKDRSLRKDLGKRARSLVEKEYAWQVVGEKIRKVYSE
jgi:glycosyltransferase involved in cell wall biosynthesis